MGIDTLEYWENYLQGLLDTLHSREKGRFRIRAFWGPDREIEEGLTWSDEARIYDEIKRVQMYINLLKAIKKANVNNFNAEVFEND